MNCYRLFLTFVAGFLVSMSCYAEVNLTAIEIIERAESNASGFKDMSNRLSMMLIDEDGDVSKREMLVKTITLKNGGSKTLTVFTKPSREKGIALLTHANPEKNDEQWLYLPASKRVKKIASNKKGASFRGSEFTYEDISIQRRENYTFNLVSTEKCGDLDCYVIDRFPKFDESSYSKTRLFIDAEYFLLQKSEFFDEDSTLIKIMVASGYSKHENGIWKPGSIVMTNQKNKKVTELKSLELNFDVGLTENDFSKLSLRKIR